MAHEAHAYIDGARVDPAAPVPYHLVSPATEEVILTLGLSGAAEVDRAVAAAQRALPAFAASSVADRIDLIRRIVAEYTSRFEAFAQAMTREMGTPIAFSREAQAPSGTAHLETIVTVLESFEFGHKLGNTRIEIASENALATKTTDGRIVLALWNYAEPGETVPPRAFTIRLNGLKFKKARMQFIAPGHASALESWKAMGAPALPSLAQIEALKKSSELPPPQTVSLTNAIILGPQTLVLLEF